MIRSIMSFHIRLIMVGVFSQYLYIISYKIYSQINSSRSSFGLVLLHTVLLHQIGITRLVFQTKTLRRTVTLCRRKIGKCSSLSSSLCNNTGFVLMRLFSQLQFYMHSFRHLFTLLDVRDVEPSISIFGYFRVYFWSSDGLFCVRNLNLKCRRW